ncbi:MAG: hypothetical protein ACT4ON_11345 [Bacteroidota bacterium]
MKNLVLILLLLSTFCLAQKENKTAPKPATDDCPDFKKKKNSSKAEYLYFLRTNKAKDPQTVNQSAAPGVPRSREVTRPSSADDPFNTPKMARRTQSKSSRKNPENPETIVSSDHIKGEPKAIEEKTPEIIEVKNAVPPVTEDIKKGEKTEEVISSKENEEKSEIVKEEKAEVTSVKGQTEAAGGQHSVKEKPEKSKKAKSISSSGKTVKFRKRNAGKCPDF